MRTLLTALCLLLATASAQAATSFACTRTFESVLPGGYLIAGTCVVSAAGVPSATGDPLTPAGTGDACGAPISSACMQQTGATVCGSAARVLKSLLLGNLSAPAGGTATAYTTSFDHTNFKVLLHGNGAAAANAFNTGTSSTGTTWTMTFQAVCQ